jgi:hypothetical protein
LDIIEPSTEALEANVETIDASLEATNWVQQLAFLGEDSYQFARGTR